MISLVLAAAITCGPNATQIDLDVCAASQRTIAEAREQREYATTLRRFPASSAELAHSESAWKTARERACAFDDALVAGGSIEPMIDDQCRATAADSRVRVLDLFIGTPNAHAGMRDAIGREHDRIYGLLEELVSGSERQLLASSEEAWLRYRHAACAYASALCADVATRDRTQQLKDSWMADPFW